MKNQYLVVFIASVFLVACTTTPKSNNYSYTETGRWIASVEEKSNAKASAIMLLTDQAVSSCRSIQEILSKTQEQLNRGEVVQVSEDDIKLALLEFDDDDPWEGGKVSLKNDPDCKNKIYALAQVVCDSANDGDPFCDAVSLRRQIDRYMLHLQTADSETVEGIIEELREKIEEQEQEYSKLARQRLLPEYNVLDLKNQLKTATDEEDIRKITRRLEKRINLRDRGPLRDKNEELSGMILGALAFGIPAVGAVTAGGVSAIIGSFLTFVFGAVLVAEVGILLYSLVRLSLDCFGSGGDLDGHCFKEQIVRVHNNVWSGIVKIPVAAVGYVGGKIGSFFRKIFSK